MNNFIFLKNQVGRGDGVEGLGSEALGRRGGGRRGGGLQGTRRGWTRGAGGSENYVRDKRKRLMVN